MGESSVQSTDFSASFSGIPMKSDLQTVKKTAVSRPGPGQRLPPASFPSAGGLTVSSQAWRSAPLAVTPVGMQTRRPMHSLLESSSLVKEHNTRCQRRGENAGRRTCCRNVSVDAGLVTSAVFPLAGAEVRYTHRHTEEAVEARIPTTSSRARAGCRNRGRLSFGAPLRRWV